MATPALRALATHYPGAEIDVVTTDWSAPALAGNPHVARIILYPNRLPMVGLHFLARTLRRTGYDLGIGLDPSTSTQTQDGFVRTGTVEVTQ